MQLRPYRAEDLPELAELFTMSVRILARQHYDETQINAWAPLAPDLDEWANRFSTVQTLVMEESGCPLGFISWRIDCEAEAYISLLFVRPDTARKGVASQLLAAAEATLARMKRLSVHASLVARPFFEQHGYEIIREERVIRDGIEFIRYEMRKDRPTA
jgi:putative acetyltransferase